MMCWRISLEEFLLLSFVMLFVRMCSDPSKYTAASIAETKPPEYSLQNKKFFSLFFFFLSRLMKSESTDSLLSQASGGNGSHNAVVVTRKRSERSVSLTSMVLKQSGQPHKAATRSGSASCISATESETSKPVKESRSQKHTRVRVCFLCFGN